MIAQDILARGGYRVTSRPALNKLMKDHGIKGKKRDNLHGLRLRILKQYPINIRKSHH